MAVRKYWETYFSVEETKDFLEKQAKVRAKQFSQNVLKKQKSQLEHV